MKLRLGQKLIMLIGAALLLIVGVLLFVSGFQFRSIDLQREGSGFFTRTRMLVFLIGIFVTGYSLFLLSLPRRMNRSEEGFVVQKTASGELRISLSAIQQLSVRCVKEISGIRMKSVKVKNNHNQVSVDADVIVPAGTPIPKLIERLQHAIRQTVLNATGVKLHDVRVSVEPEEADHAEALVHAPVSESVEAPCADPAEERKAEPAASEAITQSEGEEE